MLPAIQLAATLPLSFQNAEPAEPYVTGSNYELHLVTQDRPDAEQVIADTIALYKALPDDKRANLIERDAADYREHLNNGGIILAYYKDSAEGAQIFAGSAMVTKSLKPMGEMGTQFQIAQGQTPRLITTLELGGVMRAPVTGKGFLGAVDLALNIIAGDEPAIIRAVARNGSVNSWMRYAYVGIDRFEDPETGVEKTVVLRSINNAFRMGGGAPFWAGRDASTSKYRLSTTEQDSWENGLVTVGYTEDRLNSFLPKDASSEPLPPIAHMRELVI